ncbi:dynein light chain roadblock-type 2 [Biomphalaria glabrata]|uniref:Dynein light chain roadblock n=3 Tax=Biomphalaria TaxID=6525 RepID=A0A2C9LIP1_BIOGL|nr:dynein light chain roadblock-type 2-like [Biomphalaria glabrata]KAI8746670.1 dynein light chain roadblock-type 2 [Biomphalaria glabrata]KAI8763774.1 dynein light chain roadblock-type 2-like [Biomphalaria glabrata]KAK0045009.1 dynein light chain roadblock-type 2 [Biomphalaria pfeifferi]
MSQEIDDTVRRIQSHKGVMGVIIVNADGIPLKSTLDNTTSVHYASLIHSLAKKARSVIKEIDSTNDLKFLRVRSKKHEILVAPEHNYSMIVIQKDVN